jgi:hypothetical protein
MLPVLIGTAVYVAGNLYLWSLRQSPFALFLETLPLGIIAGVAFFWWLTRPAR